MRTRPRWRPLRIPARVTVSAGQPNTSALLSVRRTISRPPIAGSARSIALQRDELWSRGARIAKSRKPAKPAPCATSPAKFFASNATGKYCKSA